MFEKTGIKHLDKAKTTECLKFFQVVAKDTNVMLVTLAAKIMTDLGNGLRKKFSQHAVGVSIMDRNPQGKTFTFWGVSIFVPNKNSRLHHVLNPCEDL